MKKVSLRGIGTILFLVLLVASLAACGSGGGGGGSTPSAREGQFIDSRVEGLKYLTDTLTGITNSEGTFKYEEGEIVTFYIEDIILGQASGKQTINPIDLVVGATNEMDSTVTNICRFIQSLDIDVNPDNGINITTDIRNVVAGRFIDFSQSETDFENDLEVQNLFNTLNALDFPNTLVSAYQAQSHLRQALGTVGPRPYSLGHWLEIKCYIFTCYRFFEGIYIINKGEGGDVFVSVSTSTEDYSVVFYMDYGETVTVLVEYPSLQCGITPITTTDFNEIRRALIGDVSNGPFTVQRQNDNPPACP